MTRAEIIAKLKEAKGPLSPEDSFKMADEILAFMPGENYFSDIMRALNRPHPISLAFAISLVEREKPGWQKNIVDYSGAAPAKACIGSSISGTWHEGATPAIALVLALLSADATP